jgi:hypothetical protein
MQYPKWKYHRTKEPVIVHDPEQEAALGPGWYESPADVEREAEPEAEPVSKIEPVPGPTVQTPVIAQVDPVGEQQSRRRRARLQ